MIRFGRFGKIGTKLCLKEWNKLKSGLPRKWKLHDCVSLVRNLKLTRGKR